MTKARDLADLISAGNPLADGVIAVAEVTGAAPLASPTFTGTVTIGGVTYPTSDGTNGQFIQTDGAGALTFQSVPTINALNDIANVSITSAASGEVLSWNGSSWVNSTLEAFDTQTATTTATTQTSIATYATADYDGVKAVITADDGTERSITEIVITHDGTTAIATEYAQVNTNTALATFDVDISGGNIRILATPAAATSTGFTVKAITL
jgi:hypothetical protein